MGTVGEGESQASETPPGILERIEIKVKKKKR
jgi:hypothetical protein